MKVVLTALAALLFLATPSPRLDAQIHDDVVCWEPDIEFPVPCDDEE